MRTFAINGAESHPHELGENLWSMGFSGAIPVINVYFHKKSAYLYSEITPTSYATILIGTPEAITVLLNPQNDKFIVDVASDWEYTLFNLRKDSFGLWHAQSPRIKDIDLLLGLSDKINYDLIIRASQFFESGASNLTLAYPVVR